MKVINYKMIGVKLIKIKKEKYGPRLKWGNINKLLKLKKEPYNIVPSQYTQ